MTTTAPVSRRTALIGSIALLTGGTGLAASTASALAAPAERKKSTKRAKATTGLTLPTSWKGTIFDAPRQNELQGYIDSYTELREYGAISKLSQKRLNECEGIVTFEDVDHPGESFTVKVSRSVRLGYAATPATLVGDRGTRIAAHLDLVRTANPKVRALIVTVDGRESTTRRLPAKTPIVADLAPTDTIGQALESAVAVERQVARDLEAAADPYDEKAYATAIDLAERFDIWETDSRISATLAGLGLSHIPTDRPTGELSGGQQARLSLAWLLLNRPDILLLDEPTNHLDDAATTYLVSVLSAWKGPVLFASHDRAFLDTAASGIVDLERPEQDAPAIPSKDRSSSPRPWRSTAVCRRPR